MSNRRQWAWPILAALVLTGTAGLQFGGYLDRLEAGWAEARARLLAHEVASDIVIVGIDAQSLAALDEWPWPRRHFARLLQQLQRSAPQSVFIDVDFSARSPSPDDDLLFERALENFSVAPVVLASHFKPTTDSVDSASYPLPRFARHASQAAVVLAPDRDGLVRRARSSWRIDDSVVRAAFDADARLPDGEVTLIDYSILPSSFGYVSFSELLNGRIDPASLRGKTIYVGALAVELHDNVPVPVHRSLPGVLLQALAAETVRRGPLRTPSPGTLFAIIALFTCACAWLLDMHSWRRNAAVVAAGAGLLTAASIYLYDAHRIDLPLVPFATALGALFVCGALRSLDVQTLRAVAYAVSLRRRDALLRSIVESTTDSIVCVDAAGAIRTANAAAGKLLGETAASLIDAPIASFVAGLTESLESPPASAAEYVVARRDGQCVPVEVSVSRVAVDDTPLFTVILRDITERKAQQQRLDHQATHDALTGLPNRTALVRHLEQVLPDASAGQRVALLLVDLARFREVNDTLGHDLGDRILVEAASRIAAVESGTLVARIGADDFAVVLWPVAQREHVNRYAKRLLDCLKAPFSVHNIAIEIGATAGISLASGSAHDPRELLRRADVALHNAKRRGAPHEYYDSGHDQHTVRRLGMISELRAAMMGDGLHLHYQPQVNLANGRIESVEALLRWRHPTFGEVRPDEFIGLAESSHLIRPLTQWTLHQALTDLAAWKRRGLTLRVAVNLSATVLQDEALAEQLGRLLEAYAVDAAQLELEVTESAMMHDPERARDVVRSLHELGTPVSIDDYGTGFSSLGYLRDLAATALKLDKSFVLDLETCAKNRVIAESTVQLAHALGLEIVAEGVESAWIQHYLARLGFDYGQGFHFSRPLPADDCTAFVASFNASACRAAG